MGNQIKISLEKCQKIICLIFGSLRIGIEIEVHAYLQNLHLLKKKNFKI